MCGMKIRLHHIFDVLEKEEGFTVSNSKCELTYVPSGVEIPNGKFKRKYDESSSVLFYPFLSSNDVFEGIIFEKLPNDSDLVRMYYLVNHEHIVNLADKFPSLLERWGFKKTSNGWRIIQEDIYSDELKKYSNSSMFRNYDRRLVGAIKSIEKLLGTGNFLAVNAGAKIQNQSRAHESIFSADKIRKNNKKNVLHFR